MVPSVTKVLAGEHYLLFIDFDNGERGSLDMKPYLDFGIFQKLKDPAAFKQVRVAFDTIEWDSGPDLDPEFVYAKCKSPSGLQNNEFELHFRSREPEERKAENQ